MDKNGWKHVIDPEATAQTLFEEQTGQHDIVVATSSHTRTGASGIAFDGQREAEIPTQRLAYLKTTCATCEAPLDVTEQSLNIERPNLYCSQTRSSDHLPLLCQQSGCGEKFATLQDLRNHFGGYFAHACLNCNFPGCGELLQNWQVSRHYRKVHADAKIYCAQCGTGFSFAAQLDYHAGEANHLAYTCRVPDCNSEFTRIGELNRHQLVHQPDVPRHPCPHCRKYRGAKGFKRRDHLFQHIRNYHHINDDVPTEGNQSGYPCHFEDCDRVGMSAFDTEQLLKAHLRKEHPSPFQCSYPECERVGTKGWFRESDMVKHMRKKHGV